MTRLLHSAFIRWLISLIFSKMPFLIPAKLLRKNRHLLAFFHPKPAYPTHIVLVPRSHVRTLLDLAPDDPFLVELIHVTQELVEQFSLSSSGYRLIVNGGDFQEFPHLHFHLISDTPTPKTENL